MWCSFLYSDKKTERRKHAYSIINRRKNIILFYNSSCLCYNILKSISVKPTLEKQKIANRAVPSINKTDAGCVTQDSAREQQKKTEKEGKERGIERAEKEKDRERELESGAQCVKKENETKNKSESN